MRQVKCRENMHCILPENACCLCSKALRTGALLREKINENPYTVYSKDYQIKVEETGGTKGTQGGKRNSWSVLVEDLKKRVENIVLVFKK
jgi:hypothetical protein